MSSWLMQHWYQVKKPALVLRLLSMLYRTVIAVRYLFYRNGLFKQKRLSVPVIVVGNITVGGTGKTPLVIALAKMLTARGFHPGIISRGYGRDHDAPMRVRNNMMASQVGDEPLMMSMRLTCPIWVGANRVETAKRLLSTSPQVDVIISDDGLQHYPLARDIELVVFDAERGIGNGCLLPAGPLRESLQRMQRADYAIINGKPSQQWPWLNHIAHVNMQLKFTKLSAVNSKLSKQIPPSLSALRAKKIHAVAGIGNPQRFFNILRAQGLTIIPHAFQDHHHYQIKDFNAMQDAPIIMTEKDAVKCRDFALTQAWYLPVTASLGSELIEYIVMRLQILRGQHG